MHDEALVYWSARASGAALFAAAMLAGRPFCHRTSPAAMRLLWTGGCALLVAHEVFALGLWFDWSQSAAWRRIAEQTFEATGVAFGGGLLVNYFAAAVWTADVAWWWLAPASHAGRPRSLGVALWTFLALMFFFGAVVFAEGWTRTIAAAMFAIAGTRVVAAWLRNAHRGRPVGCSASTPTRPNLR